jgi:hypothetical protein
MFVTKFSKMLNIFTVLSVTICKTLRLDYTVAGISKTFAALYMEAALQASCRRNIWSLLPRPTN